MSTPDQDPRDDRPRACDGSSPLARGTRGLPRNQHTISRVGYAIFSVSGNKYRIIADVVFRSQTAFIKNVFTHKEYGSWKP
ncbi:type II toxin-antitoxin system HigB family toxin [Pusillimonas sp. MFBS29]|uniref:type II toxin-antitoxin system HigB family toxin n=1 Tax=Pusillimonas sp. MFBS29 TaxID=2886690 RepID=UPI001D110E6D|nr:type II toxin-antitoxin system HigB family toxin [Pusillimonas sp. MFBS29]